MVIFSVLIVSTYQWEDTTAEEPEKIKELTSPEKAFESLSLSKAVLHADNKTSLLFSLNFKISLFVKKPLSISDISLGVVRARPVNSLFPLSSSVTPCVAKTIYP